LDLGLGCGLHAKAAKQNAKKRKGNTWIVTKVMPATALVRLRLADILPVSIACDKRAAEPRNICYSNPLFILIVHTVGMPLAEFINLTFRNP